MTLRSIVKQYLSGNNKDFQDIYWIPGDILTKDILGFSYYFSNNIKDEIQALYYLPMSWICTDTRVGLRLYFNHRIFLGYSTQRGRKDDEYFVWYSERTKTIVKNILLKKLKEEEEDATLPSLYCKDHFEEDLQTVPTLNQFVRIDQ